MLKPDAKVWENIRRAHLENKITLSEIAKQFGVTSAQISYRARKEKWPPRPNVIMARAGAAKSGGGGRRTPRLAATTSGARAVDNVVPLRRTTAKTQSLVKAARERLAEKLDNLRILLNDGKHRKSTESERESRDLLGIINGIAKTQEIENDLAHLTHAAAGSRGTNGRGSGTVDPRDLAERAEALRRTLAERLARRRKPD
jgi:transposase-like protein